MSSFFVYMLRCSDSSYYVGHTHNLELRLAEHRQGSLATSYTYDRRPVILVWSAEFSSRDEALVREKQLKGWSRAKKEALIRNDWSGIRELAHSNEDVLRRVAALLAQDRG